jgi:hypothetical protein
VSEKARPKNVQMCHAALIVESAARALVPTRTTPIQLPLPNPVNTTHRESATGFDYRRRILYP